MSYYNWKPYVPVALRRANAILELDAMQKKGMEICPIQPFKGRKIAKTFWGEGWCKHLEQFSDFDNRLPRGRTYVRNGSVCHLGISKGHIHAYVSGSELYEVNVQIKTMPQNKWGHICKSCTGHIGSLLELLQGRFSNEVMRIVTDPDDGLFPLPDEITLDCSCPDGAVMCKHVAAVLYGVGVRLDQSPELLFKLRGTDTADLIGGNALAAANTTGSSSQPRRRLKGNVAAVFGVELDEAQPQPPTSATDNLAKPKRKPHATKQTHTKSKSNRISTPQKSKQAQTPPALTAKAVAKLRKKMGQSVAAFAEEVGVTAQTIYNWEKKKGTLKLQIATEERLRKIMASAN